MNKQRIVMKKEIGIIFIGALVCILGAIAEPSSQSLIARFLVGIVTGMGIACAVIGLLLFRQNKV
jgi:hypothetical protein